MAYVIGIDLGTQSLKAILSSPDGKIVAEACCEHYPDFPFPNWAQQDPIAWINSLENAINKLFKDSRVKAEDVGTIGFASQVDGIVLTNCEGNPLMEAIIWLDRRAERECEDIAIKESGDNIFNITGLNLDSSHVAPKMLWLKKNRNELFEKADGILVPGSFIVNYLTGEKVIDYSNASSTMLYDVGKKEWSNHMEKVTGLSVEKMGRLMSAQSIVNTLKPAIARKLGLSSSTKVVVGSGDEHGACLGAGLIRPGLVCNIMGTAEPIAAIAKEAVFDRKHLVETHAHADPRWWLIENPGFVSGGSVRWYTDTVLRSNYDDVNTLAQKSQIGSKGLIFLPCLSGSMTPMWNGNARGVFFGMTISHGIEDMTRSVLEGCVFGFRDNIDRFDEMGLNCSEVRVVGGGSKSDLWCQMKADATGKMLRLTKNPEGTAIGATMLAHIGEGNFSSFEEASDVLVEFGQIFEPKVGNKIEYDDAYNRYMETYHTLDPLFTKLYKKGA